MIRSLLISSVASVALASGALASDLPNTKGPAPFVPPPPPAFTWTGCYVGGNAGLSGGDFNKTTLFPLDADGYWTADSATSRGFSGGGQVGCNYQFPTSNFVVGLETDFQGSTLKGTYYNESEGDIFGSEYAKSSSQVDWWGTVRGRVGYAFDNILPYVTGGFAYGRVVDSFSYNDTIDDEGSSGSWSHGSTRAGWTVGAGLEYAITHNLTFKTEYLYTDLGTWCRTWTYPDEPAGYAQTTRIKTTFSTVRAGLNWKFDWFAPPVPIVAKY